MGQKSGLEAESALQAKRYRLHRDYASRWRCFFTRPFGHIGEKYRGAFSDECRRCVICHTITTKPRQWWYDFSAES